MMRFTAVLALGALASVATMTTAAADPYGAIIGGTAFFVGRIPGEIDANINPTCTTTQGTCDPATFGANPGFRFGAAFGTTLEDGAAEFEAMFTRVRLRDFQVPPGPVTPVNMGGGPSRASQITLTMITPRAGTRTSQRSYHSVTNIPATRRINIAIVGIDRR